MKNAIRITESQKLGRNGDSRKMQTPAVTLGDSWFPPVVAIAGGQEPNGEVSPERRVAFEDVLSHNLPRFQRMAMRWLRNPEDAEDAVQDAMLSAYKHIARFEGRAQMSTWLMAIVINAVRMQIRRRARHKAVALDQAQQDEPYTLAELIADPRPTPEQILGEWEIRTIILKVSRSLPPSQQAAIRLRQRDGLSIKEAAEVLGVPTGTLKARLARGRVTLTQRVRKAIGESGIQTAKYGSKVRGKMSSDSRCRRDLAEEAAPRQIRKNALKNSREVAVEGSSVPA